MSLVTGSETAGGAAWSDLEQHRDQLVGGSLRDLFAADPERGERLAVSVGDLWVDYSKHPVTDETISLLVDLAAQRDVPGFIRRMLSGERVNTTEDRPALHTALRAPADTAIVVDGTDVVPGVEETLGRMADVAVRLRSGHMSGATGRPITAMVSLGIGGSHLGPAMATEALAHLAHPGLGIFIQMSRHKSIPLHRQQITGGAFIKATATIRGPGAKLFFSISHHHSDSVVVKQCHCFLGVGAISYHITGIN